MDYDDYNNYEGNDDDDNNYQQQDILSDIPNQKKLLVWLSSNDIYQLIKKKVQDISEIIDLPLDQTLLLLRYFQWNKDYIDNEYFGNEVKFKQLAGIIPQQQQEEQNTLNKKPLCPICLQTTISFDALECNQKICVNCWKLYINNQITQKCPQLFFTCPFEKCNLVVPESFLLKYLNNSEQNTYKKLLGKYYCEESKTMKWCPAPGCNYACENSHLIYQFVTCECGYSFCFKCLKENHQPCDCSKVNEWDLKNSAESGYLKWIQLNTKMCPNQKCRKPIEKNQGCNHMTCKPPTGCGYEFCWLCLGPWKEHNDKTGGYYKCNKYEGFSQVEKEQQQKNIDRDKSILEKYIFYFERFNNNKLAQSKAVDDKKKIQLLIQWLHQKQNFDLTQIEFLNDAGIFLIEARRILKWTYCYGYYITNKNEKELFEFHQADFERNLEQLHELIEVNYDNYFIKEDLSFSQSKFDQYKQKVVNYTVSTKKFMTGIIQSIENGLLESK